MSATDPSTGRPGSVGTLISDVFRQGTALFKTEMLLARTEISEKVSRGVAGLGLMIFGAVFLIGALNVLLAACVTGLVEAGLSPAIASVIVTIGAGLVGIVLVRLGMSRMKVSALVPDRTADQLRRDAAMVQETTR